MKFCSQCGAPLRLAVPVGDERERLCCTQCGFIHYQNPKVLVACMMSWEDKLLWMRRAQPPFAGSWGAPMGFMEEGETPRMAAVRELREETLVDVDPDSLSLYIVGSLVRMNQIHVVFRGRMPSASFGIGEEALEVALFAEHEMPWAQFAYPEVEEQSRQYYRELRTGRFGAYLGEITERGTQLLPMFREKDIRDQE
jgi:ADP-ribose pyrophosphatase YjhB (NUDIX family)